MTKRTPRRFIRPLVRRLNPYVPGEQPRAKGLIKLNTNENPFPPSPKVSEAIKAAVDQRLRLYPNPTSQLLREKLARLHGCRPENVFVGNGSDEVLALAVRCFVEPTGRTTKRNSKSVVQFFTPSYSLYPVLGEIHGARNNAVRLSRDFRLPSVAELNGAKKWDFRAALTLITTPNAPSGRGYTVAELQPLCRAQNGVIVLDEAYVDFASENALSLGLKYPHVLIARTFSKAYSLCFQRVGYCVGHSDLIAALDKIRDSYNVNGLGQVAALATLADLPYYQANFRKIIATRKRLSSELVELGFEVLPSQTNFILARPPRYPAAQWLEKLRRQKILVRWFNYPEVREYLRITIGTPWEAAALVTAVRRVLS